MFSWKYSINRFPRTTVPVHHRRASGVAVMMVIVAVALCSVMGYAMLWGASLNVQQLDNAVLAAQADSLAESGINLASYYLRYPQNAPSGFLTSSDTYSATGLSLGAGVNGTINLAVARDIPGGWDFTITSTGISKDGDIRIAQTLKSTVHCETIFSPVYTFSSAGNVSLAGLTVKNTSATPDAVQTNGSFASVANVVTGDVAAASVIGAYAGTVTPAPYQTASPTWAQINFAGPTYTHNGVTYNADAITSPLSLPLPAPSATNPLHIYFCNGDLSVILAANTTLTDTTLVVNGRLIMGASGDSASWRLTTTPLSGAPALVVNGPIEFPCVMKKLTANGVVWARDGVQGIMTGGLNLGCNVTLRGAFLTSNWPDPRTFGGSMSMLYDASYVDVPEFSAVSNQVPTAIYMRSFSP
jgi:hypothetical protein